MSEPFLAEIRIISFSFAPKGWALCNGQTLQINQNQALFSILGTNYGGDGRTTFGLPNLQGRVPVHVGNGIVLGQRGGETAHTLSVLEMPAHTHPVQATSDSATVTVPTGNYLASSPGNLYVESTAGGLIGLNAQSISTTNSNQSHENMSPYLVLNFIIALQGIFPSQN